MIKKIFVLFLALLLGFSLTSCLKPADNNDGDILYQLGEEMQMLRFWQYWFE